MHATSLFRRRWWCVLGAAAACSAPVEPPKQPASPPVSAPAALVADAAPDAVPPDAPAVERVPTGEAHIEGAGGIQVHVQWEEDTGTTHVATHLEIRTAEGAIDLASAGDENEDPLPIMERVLAVGDHRWVLLGWASPGEGMQTEYAWLVDDTKTLHVVDKLAWTTDRSHAGIALDTFRSPLEIGIPLPSAIKDPEGEGLHNAEYWELAYGSKHVTLAALKNLRATAMALATLPAFYTPPDQDPPGREWTGRFVWFETKTTFAPRR